MKTFDQWVQDYEGKTVGYPTNNSYYGQCLSLTKWHIKEVYGIEPPASGCNGARCYWSLFPSPLGTVLKKVPNTPDLIPKRGWIAVWNGNVGGGAGHIASVLSATINNFTSLDQNWGGTQAHRVTHTYDNVEGFLAPIGEEETMTTLYTYLGVNNDEEAKTKLKQHLGEVGGKCNWGAEGENGGDFGYARKQNRELRDENAQQARTILDQQTRIEELEDQVVPTTPVNWEENGKTIETTEGNIKTIINYRRVA